MSLKLARVLSNITLPITRMAEEQQRQVMAATPWVADALPVVVVVLIAAHVIALVYWIYRLATEKQSARRKAH
uniref:Uncharacterized protein n=1 Tax=Kalanchoe fedtschenkoi TaxID=63787 RepID=A0A7N0TA14_KALFE